MNFKRIKEKRNLILLAIFVGSIAGCNLTYQYDAKKDKERTEILTQLPQLSSQESIAEAIHAPETKPYIFLGYHFDSYDLVKDPEKLLDGEYLYINYTTYTWEKKERKDGFGRKEKYHDWSYGISHLPKYATVYLDKGIELDCFNRAEIEGATNDTTRYKDSKHKAEYKYLLPNTKFSFIAELGNHKAKLGYQGARALIVGNDRDALIKKTNKESSSFGILFTLLAAGIASLVLIYIDLKKK